MKDDSTRCQYLLTFGNQEISFNHIGWTKSEFLYLSKKKKKKNESRDWNICNPYCLLDMDL